MMTLHLNQLVYTSFQNSGLQLLASDNVSANIRDVFMERIVEQYWDPSNPYEARYQAAYVHQVTPQDSFFGWVFNESLDQGYVPLFLCYHLEGALTSEVLKSIFVCLQQGPVNLVKPQGAPPQLASLALENLTGYSAARSGVSVPQDIQTESFSALQQDESLSLFVPSLGADYAVPIEKTDEFVSDLKTLQFDRQRLLAGGLIVGGLATILGVSFFQLRPSTPVFTTAPSKKTPKVDSAPKNPLASFSAPKVLPQNQSPLGPQLQRPTEKSEGVGLTQQQDRQQAASLQAAARFQENQQAKAIKEASRRQAISTPLKNQPEIQQTSPVSPSINTASEPEESILDALRPPSSTARYATVTGVDLSELGLRPSSPDRSSSSKTVPLTKAPIATNISPKPAEQKAPVAQAPIAQEKSRPASISPSTPPPTVVTAAPSPSQPPVGIPDDSASRLAEIAASQELANALSRGLVVANRLGDVPYRSSTYLRVQNVIRQLRQGEQWEQAAGDSGIPETIYTLAQLSYDADLNAASATIKKGVTTHDIANAISRT